jgi:hypothetical protein
MLGAKSGAKQILAETQKRCLTNEIIGMPQ